MWGMGIISGSFICPVGDWQGGDGCRGGECRLRGRSCRIRPYVLVSDLSEGKERGGSNYMGW